LKKSQIKKIYKSIIINLKLNFDNNLLNDYEIIILIKKIYNYNQKFKNIIKKLFNKNKNLNNFNHNKWVRKN